MPRYALTVECPEGTTNYFQCLDHMGDVTPGVIAISELQGGSSGFLGLPEITVEEAGILCGAIAAILGTAWIFKQVGRQISSWR